MSKFDKFVTRFVLLLLCIAVLSCVAAWAQSTTEGAIGGTVADPQDKVVPGATVIIKNLGSNEEVTIKTDSSGYFRVGQLEPATYTVIVHATGFAPYRAAQVIVTVGSLTTLNPQLTIGTTEKVDVTAEAPVVNTVSAEFAPTLNETAIENLPINGGRWSSFAVLTPGVVSNYDGFGLLSFRGMSAVLNNVTVDGADNNQAFFSEERGRTRAGYSTAKITVQEFQVNTSNYSSEYGRSAGGVVNTVTKSGSNQIHGEGFWYDRNNEWGSTNPYTTLTSVANNAGVVSASTDKYKPVDVRKMGAFSVGGPIIKDKLFWFFGYDRMVRNFPGTGVPNSASSFYAVPDAALPTGGCNASGLSAADINVCTLSAELYYKFGNPSTSGATPQIKDANATAGYAAARQMWVNGLLGAKSTDPGSFGYNQYGVYSVGGRVPRTGDQNIMFPKVDWIINQRNHAQFEVNRMRWSSPGGVQTQATNAYGLSSFGNDYVKDTWGVAKLDTMITNNISNQFRFQYGRDFEYETDQASNPFENQTLTNPVNPLTGVATGYVNPNGLPPNVYIGAFQWGTLYYTNRIAYPDEYRMQFADTVSITRGKHAFKFGADFVRTRDTINNLYQQYGEYSFGGLPQYFAQLYDPANAYFSDYYQGMQGGSAANTPENYQFHTVDLAFFVHDDWKMSRRLTVNLGLRYETELLPSPYTNLEMSIPLGSQTITTGKMPNRSNGWGPRVGFALDVFGNSKTVVRGGYGLYYGRILNAQIFGGLVNTGNISDPMSQVTFDYFANKGTQGGKSLGAFPFPYVYNMGSQVGIGSVTANYFAPNFTLPQIQEFDLNVQHEFGWHTVLSVSYLGSLGRHLPNYTDINMATPGTPYCSKVSSGSPYVKPGTSSTPATYLNQTDCAALVGYGTTYNWLTPPQAISYTLTNMNGGTTIGNMPLQEGSSLTVPFYTSRLNPGYGAIVESLSGTNSNYNALAIQLEKRFTNHLQFSFNYTWSHALDNGVNGTTSLGGTSQSLVDPLNMKYALYGNSSNNVPQRFTAHMVVEAPWKHTGAIKYLLDGWQASPMIQIQKGLGYSVNSTGSTAVTIGGQKYPAIGGGMVGGGGSSMIPGTERNGWLQPSTYICDLRLSKQFPIGERVKAEFSADGFNIFNHNNVTGISTSTPYKVNQTSGNPTLSPNTSAFNAAGTSSNFGVPTSGNSNFVYNTRQLQLGFRVTF